jgi:hypothetical protein
LCARDVDLQRRQRRPCRERTVMVPCFLGKLVLNGYILYLLVWAKYTAEINAQIKYADIFLHSIIVK